MDIHLVYLISGIWVSFWFGFVLNGFITRREERKKLRRETYGYVSMSMTSRDALHRLESGDVEDVKRFLGDAVASFYHNFRKHPQFRDDMVASERRQIETQAKSSSILADALKKRKEAGEKPVA